MKGQGDSGSRSLSRYRDVHIGGLVDSLLDSYVSKTLNPQQLPQPEQQRAVNYLMRQSQGKLYFVGDGISVASALNGLESSGRTGAQSCTRQTKGAHSEREALNGFVGVDCQLVK